MTNKTKSWYKPKGYIHFSPKLDKTKKSFVENYILNKLEKHNFFPLIHETLSARRYKSYLNKENKIYRSHFDYIKNKPSAKPRDIFYANHLDAHIYSYFSNNILGKLYEDLLSKDSLLSDSIIAYRRIPLDKTNDKSKFKCNIHFANELFKEIESRGNCVVACYDIENFFPSLSHEYLKNCWIDLVGDDKFYTTHERVFNSLTKYSFVNIKDLIEQSTNDDLGIKHKNDFKNSDLNSYFINCRDFREKIAKKNLIRKHKPKSPSELLKGIPQGTPISAFLANLYLLEFDKFIINDLVRKENCFYRRYSDDIAIIFNSIEDFERISSDILTKISTSPLNLKINNQKTVVSIFKKEGNQLSSVTKVELSQKYTTNDSLKYLGFEYSGNNILLKNIGLSKFYREMKMSIRRKANRANCAIRYNKKYPKRKQKNTKLHLTKLYKRFTHLAKKSSKGNFLTYVDRASYEIYPESTTLNNPIRKQVVRAWSIFQKSISKYEKINKPPLKKALD